MVDYRTLRHAHAKNAVSVCFRCRDTYVSLRKSLVAIFIALFRFRLIGGREAIQSQANVTCTVTSSHSKHKYFFISKLFVTIYLLRRLLGGLVASFPDSLVLKSSR